ncbi:hypothetical protein SELMODRAFT_110016 [Selaginella moellendorffii]|uniref:Pentacotripeptide-repeat region of PRORP domain-containing protein n=2 Tax=Selaginella moellendorffii TaxID=88036 RepID=D8S6N3_SELML|nr:hypothetical protein SELMODRAFT_110016 [Selaginella moellendorffii]
MPEQSLVSCTTILQAYAQNGHLKEAAKMHSWMLEQDHVSWSCMVSAHAHFGRGRDAIEMFHVMVLEGFEASKVTLLSLLIACSHTGKLERCRREFVGMAGDYLVIPRCEHYCCMVDILGRAGHHEEAKDLLWSMPFEPSPIAWSAMLGSLVIHGDRDRGGEELVKVRMRFLEQQNSIL